ncbi:MAG: hypothetical protein EPN72_09830 [Nevskiaceae bacterium]|nr:MAG: hypothetical protein EPN63_09170 [Nevskiaceae bacterium]TBR72727.1 MAG: hypothetical protein EPN72_09830 [Nevskiaceae bacterium]
MKFSRKTRIPALPARSLFTAALPALNGTPLLSIEVGVETTPRSGGEETLWRLHLQSRLANAMQPITADPAVAPPAELTTRPTTRLPVPRVATLVQRGLQRGLKSRLVRRLAAPLLEHDFETWIDIKASTAPLMRGVGALMPGYADKLRDLGVNVSENDGSMAQTWSGMTHGKRPGLAQFTLLRLDKRHLPPALARLLGDQPFQAIATVAQVVEPRTAD